MGVPRFLLAPGTVGDSDPQALFPGSLVPPVTPLRRETPPSPQSPATALNFENSARVPCSMWHLAAFGSLSFRTYGGFNKADLGRPVLGRGVVEPTLFSTLVSRGLTGQKRESRIDNKHRREGAGGSAGVSRIANAGAISPREKRVIFANETEYIYSGKSR